MLIQTMMAGWLFLAGAGQEAEGEKKPARAPSETLRREATKLYGSSLILEREGRLGEALKTLEVSMVLDPEARIPRRTSIALYLRLQKPFNALEQFKDLLEAKPDDIETINLLAEHFKSLPDKAEVARLVQLVLDGGALTDDFKMKTAFLVEIAILYDSTFQEEKAMATSKLVVEALKVKKASEWLDTPQKEIDRMLLESYARLMRYEIANKNLKSAAKYLQASAKVDKFQAQSMGFSLAKAYAGDKQPALALPLILDFIQMKPSGMEAFELAIETMEALGKKKEVLELLKKSVEQDPRNLHLRQLAAREFQKEGREKDAQQVLQLVSLNQPGMQEPARPGSFAFEKNHGPKSVLAKLDSIFHPNQLQVYPPPDPSQNQAFLQELKRDLEISKQVIREGRERLKLGTPLQPDTLMHLGMLARDLEDDSSFETFFLAVPACAGNTPETYTKVIMKSLVTLSEGSEYPLMARLGEAFLSTPREPITAIIHAEVAFAHANMNNREKALSHLAKSLESTIPEHLSMARKLELFSLSALGDFEKAINRAKEGMKEFQGKPEESSFRDIHGQILYSAQRLDEAAESVQKAMALDPNNPIYCNQLGYHWADQNKNLDEAEQLIRKALSLELARKQQSSPFEIQLGNAHYLDSLGWVFFRKGNLKQAKVELEKVVQLPNGNINPEVLGHLAQVYEAMGEPDKARSHYLKALSRINSHRAHRDPDLHKQLQSRLDSLEAKARAK